MDDEGVHFLLTLRRTAVFDSFRAATVRDFRGGAATRLAIPLPGSTTTRLLRSRGSKSRGNATTPMRALRRSSDSSRNTSSSVIGTGSGLPRTYFDTL